MVMVTWVPRNIKSETQPPAAAQLQVSDGIAVSQNVFTWADHTIADQQYVVKVDPNIDTDVTAIIGCAVMTVLERHKYRESPKGESVAIFGVGGVGSVCRVGAKMVGAHPIIAVDLDDEKLAFAKQFGATHGVNAANEDPVAAIHALTVREGEFNFSQQPVSGADYTFDCIGIRQTMEQIVPACRSGYFGAKEGGTAVLVGVPTTPVELNPGDLLVNEKNFVGSIGGSCAPDHDFPRFLDWHSSGDLDLHAMVTARYNIDQINEAVTALEQGQISGRAILEFDH
ncbi:MAG: hypothetical protein CM15mP120_30410 [Pseudomonadota bacterium]|nr:MAG: hypothetical protein CM15mP120_30410 [Pseudomonadota bacterium]